MHTEEFIKQNTAYYDYYVKTKKKKPNPAPQILKGYRLDFKIGLV